jgi:hypothetical protein
VPLHADNIDAIVKSFERRLRREQFRRMRRERRQHKYESWSQRQAREQRDQFLGNAARHSYWGYLLVRRILWKAARHARRLRGRELRLRLLALGIDAAAPCPQSPPEQIRIVDTPIEPNAPCALSFA